MYICGIVLDWLMEVDQHVQSDKDNAIKRTHICTTKSTFSPLGYQCDVQSDTPTSAMQTPPFSRVLYFCINYRGCMPASFLAPMYFTIVCSSLRYLSNVLRKKWLYPESSHPVFLCLLSFDKYLYAAFDTVWGVHTCRTSKLGPLIYLWGWSPWCRERITPVSVRALSVSVLRKSKWHLLFRSQESSNSSYPLIKEDLSSVAFHRTYHR